MTSIFPESFKKTGGAITLVTSIVLIFISTLIIIFAATQGRLLLKITANQHANEKAFEAAEAGVEFAINYLKQNSSTILANPVNGYIPSYSDSNTSKTMADNSSYTITYSNPTASNYDLIEISATGKNPDQTATRTVTLQVKLGSFLTYTGNTTLVSKGTVSMTGSASITNTSTNNTIQSAQSVTLAGNSQTVTNSGVSSTAGSLQSDVQANVTTLHDTSQSDFFATYFGTTDTDKVKNSMVHYYNNSSDTNYSSTLSNMTGTSIWIDQTGGTAATINGNTTIGSTTNPVLLVVNGNFNVSGNVTIYGFVFVVGSAGINTLTGNTKIIGGMVTASNMVMSGNISLTYDDTLLSNLKKQSSLTYYAKVPGSWHDF